MPAGRRLRSARSRAWRAQPMRRASRTETRLSESVTLLARDEETPRNRPQSVTSRPAAIGHRSVELLGPQSCLHLGHSVQFSSANRHWSGLVDLRLPRLVCLRLDHIIAPPGGFCACGGCCAVYTTLHDGSVIQPTRLLSQRTGGLWLQPLQTGMSIASPGRRGDICLTSSANGGTPSRTIRMCTHSIQTEPHAERIQHHRPTQANGPPRLRTWLCGGVTDGRTGIRSAS